ncbi:unnamed protein product [Ilex paraguariensis]|uniref:CCHC-type domain-containing protein n=1 Tax=Ilex paraguariensis TaxID=185542 RepID=A0ABC8TVS9_9AQUA
MGTRTNLYKNPSYAYNKDFNLNSVLQNLRAYNVATGNAPPIEQPDSGDDKTVHHKTRPKRRPPLNRNGENEENDGPMSHQDYIDKRRMEVSSSRANQELTADVLETPGACIHLVEYGSHTDTTSEGEERQNPSNNYGSLLDNCEERQYPPKSGFTSKADQVKTRSKQRFPIPGDPVCVVCGKYGEYICNETEDDICSMDCKAELLENLKLLKGSLSSQILVESSSELKCASQVPEFGGGTWDYDRHRWSKKRSSLCTYECWKCQRPGHLAEDCLVMTSNCQPPSPGICNQVAIVQNKSPSIPRDLLELYKRCHQIGKKSSASKCNACNLSVTLATCLNCTNAFCDSAGHLSEHIRAHPYHGQYYSHKLKRLVKCCKSTCNVTDIKDLLACHYCFDKAFDKFYDMYSATWKAAGLSIIWGSICCEDHFEWHRINCLNAGVENSAYIVNKNAQNENYIQLSDFIF